MAPLGTAGGAQISPRDIESPSYDHSSDENQKTNVPDNQKECCLCTLGRKCLCIGAFAVLILAAVAGLSVAFTGSPDPRDYFVPVDPPGASEAVRWDATAGLYLTLENACDDTWTPFFDQSLLEWNETEALILTSQRVPYDAECNPSYGRLKVCNGDYGNTDWRGLNSAVLSASTDLVVYSVSKLNDFHVKTDDDRLYTMCHENGHGFGLPHTDEDHFNRDRGDCMDYTSRPWNNLKPGDFNLNLLKALYGTPTQPLLTDPLTNEVVDPVIFPPSVPIGRPPSPPPPPREWNTDNEKEEEEEDEEDRRKLRTAMMAAMENCDAAQCIHSLDKDHIVVVTKLLVE